MPTWTPQQIPVVLDALRADRIARGGLTAIDELVWRELAFRFTNKKTGACFPSYETLAIHAGCCRRTIGNSIKRLRDAGWLRWRRRWWRRKLPGGIEVVADSNSYEVRIPRRWWRSIHEGKPCARTTTLLILIGTSHLMNATRACFRSAPDVPTPPVPPSYGDNSLASIEDSGLRGSLARLKAAIDAREERQNGEIG
jgi:Helix-turn-helix domain